MKSLKYIKVYLAFGWVYVCAIVYLSLTSLPQSGIAIPMLDKVMHLGAYGLLMGWFSLLIENKKTLLFYGISFFCLGAGLELLQGMGGIRQAEWGDALANTGGIVLALALRTPTHRWLQSIEHWIKTEKI